jgi:alginate O-acetyltransferase complex protein AlgI
VIFLGAVIAFLLLVRNHRAQKLFLLLASYYFYACWDWRFLGLIFISTLVDFCVGLCLKRSDDPVKRKFLLVVSLVCNLGLLGFFKYFNFFIESMQAMIAPLGWHGGSLNILLPVGISFYTFQSLSYTIDMYRRRIKCCDDFADFALFVSFFPQLVAGPIVRASEFLTQLDTPRKITWMRAGEGFRQFTIGLFKKAFIADRIAVFVDGVFENAGVFDGYTTWLAVMCYAVQIYCDFSGYSDMAIGAARTIGYDIPVNFRYPYIARSVTDFWRRWHVSLSTWLRDYLYIPLGGNRKGPTRTCINIMIVMVLGGLWHGAAWTFVFWGALHGVALVVVRWIPTGPIASPWRRKLLSALGWTATMLVVLVAWVFFRSASGGFPQAFSLLERMFVDFRGVSWFPPFAVFALVLMSLSHALHATRWAHLRELPVTKWYTPALLFLMLWLVIVFPASGFTPFIYFQF